MWHRTRSSAGRSADGEGRQPPPHVSHRAAPDALPPMLVTDRPAPDGQVRR